jgi:hypothetical protein
MRSLGAFLSKRSSVVLFLLAGLVSMSFAGDPLFLAGPAQPRIPPVSEPFFGFTHHFYTYTFSGKAMYNGAICPGMVIIVKLMSPHSEISQQVVADSNGMYQVRIMLYGRPSERVDWELAAIAPDTHEEDLSGNYILMDNWSAQIDKPINFSSIHPPLS